jgi:chromosome partitioning related protein ParA
LNSKGGVGKTTLLANLGGLLADMGARTLLVDADPQPSLTKYFDLGYEAPQGLVEVITGGTVTHRAISRTSVSNLDLIRSNDGEAQLQHWLHTRDDRRVRLARALNNPYVRDHYDFILIDTQGAVGPLQTAAAFAADTLISPLPPDTPSIREFRSGTLRVLQRLEQDEKEPRAQLAPIQAVTRQDIEDTANAVRGFLGLPYGTWDVIFDAIWPRSLPVRSRRSLYCSTLVEAAIAEATQLRLSSLPAHRPMYPAVLAGHPLLLGVPLEWRVPDGP